MTAVDPRTASLQVRLAVLDAKVASAGADAEPGLLVERAAVRSALAELAASAPTEGDLRNARRRVREATVRLGDVAVAQLRREHDEKLFITSRQSVKALLDACDAFEDAQFSLQKEIGVAVRHPLVGQLRAAANGLALLVGEPERPFSPAAAVAQQSGTESVLRMKDASARRARAAQPKRSAIGLDAELRKSESDLQRDLEQAVEVERRLIELKKQALATGSKVPHDLGVELAQARAQTATLREALDRIRSTRKGLAEDIERERREAAKKERALDERARGQEVSA